MSLPLLIPIVQSRIENINEDEIISLLDIISNEDYFNEKELIKKISISDTEIFLNILIEEKIIEHMFKSKCELGYGDFEMLASLDRFCGFCNLPFSDPSHNSYDVFKMISVDLPQQIEEYIENSLENFVPKAYMHNLKKLKSELKYVVPFIGSGISIPLGLPNWVGLVRQLVDGLDKQEDIEAFNNYLDYGDIFNALDLLMKESIIYSEIDIKTKFKDFISQNIKRDLDAEYHNIYDLLNLKSDFYITTNYDDALTSYKDKYSTSPFVLDDITDMQELLKEKNSRIIHLHGIFERKDTMIVTIEDYNKIYENEKNKDILRGIMNHKEFLFIGFSFTDVYFEKLYSSIQKNIQGKHFIVLPDMHSHYAKQLRDKGLKPISIIVNSSSQKLTNKEYTSRYVLSLKKIINYLLR